MEKSNGNSKEKLNIDSQYIENTNHDINLKLKNDEEKNLEQVYFYVTGFGKFSNILQNPSTHLVRALPELLKKAKLFNVKLAHSEVVTVSIEDCDTTLEGIYSKICENLKNGKGSKHIVLNFGVASGSKEFRLECVGKNIKDFRCPDERGNCFSRCPIDKNKDLNHIIPTSLDMNKTCRELEKKGHSVRCSINPGEYICNYIYYKNLMISTILDDPRIKSLFVHIPTFETIPEHLHQKFMIELIQSLSQ